MIKRVALILLIFGVFFVTLSSASHLTGEEQINQIQQWNQQLIDYSQGRSSLSENEIVEVGRLREEEMLALIEEDHLAFADLLLPEEIVNNLPLRVQSYLEERTIQEGFFEVYSVSYEDERHDTQYRLIKQYDTEDDYQFYDDSDPNTFFELYLDEEKVFPFLESFDEEIPTPEFNFGDYVRVQGVKIGDDTFYGESMISLAPEGSGSSILTEGEQRVAVIMVGFSNRQFILPITYDRDLYSGSTVIGNERRIISEETIHNLFERITNDYSYYSYGKTNFVFDFYGPYEMNIPESLTSINRIAAYAQRAALSDLRNSGFRYRRFVYIVSGSLVPYPNNIVGFGTIGGGITRSWIVLGVFSCREDNLQDCDLRNLYGGRTNYAPGARYTEHELAHNLRAFHGGVLDCPSVSRLRPPLLFPLRRCISYDSDFYDDDLDIVSDSASNSFINLNPIYKERFGWFDSGEVLAVVSSGTYRLDPYDISANGIKVVKIRGRLGWYYLSFYPSNLNSEGLDYGKVYIYMPLRVRTSQTQRLRVQIQYGDDFFYNDIEKHLFRLVNALEIATGDNKFADLEITFNPTQEQLDALGIDPAIVGEEGFIRGDADGNKRIDITDAISIFNYLFLGGQEPSCLDAADVNDDGEVTLTDGVYLLNYLFQGGAEPLPPFLAAGEDLTGDGLSC